MGAYQVTNADIKLLYQPTMNYIVKFEVLNSNDVIVDCVEGVLQGGTYNIDANSEIRRTINISVTPTKFGRLRMMIRPTGIVWINKSIHMYIGIKNLRTGEYTYYSEGYYVYTDVSAKYDAQTNTLSLNLVDYMSILDGTKNGQIGALTTTIPVSSENEFTGKEQKTIIRDALIATIEQLSVIKKYNYYIEDMGETDGLSEFNSDYKNYRLKHPDWNTIPYDLKFSTGCSTLEIITKLRDLYPNVFETYFDPTDNAFNCRVIPSCIGDKCVLSNDVVQNILISEDTSLALNTVRNICEVWGASFETEFFSENVTSKNGSTYSVLLPAGTDYKEYANGDVIAFHAPVTSLKDCHINVNGMENLPVYNSSTDTPVEAGVIKKGETYAIRIAVLNDQNGLMVAYLLGNYQAHALSVLVDGTTSNRMYRCKNLPDLMGQNVKVYSKEYFADKYNCENVQLTIIGGSPFSVQKIGEILDVKCGEDYSKIYSNDLALERAISENWKNCRLTDTITITTLLIPFLDVNVKVEYQSAVQRASKPHEYIVKSISHDLDNLTSQITMYRFFPLRYKDAVSSTIGTHNALSSYRHGDLNVYTNEELAIVDENYEDDF